MNGLIRASLGNPYAVTVMSLTLIMLGVLSLTMIPIDILPVFKSPAVQTLTFYGGMSANSIANDISNRMERWTGQANGTLRQESRSIIGASIVRNYFQGDVDPNGALTQVNSLSLAVIPNLPPGTLPPVVLPFDPTAMTPVCVVAVDSPDPANNESVLYDVGRYEVRNMIMGDPGAVAPVVFGGKIRAVMAYLDRQQDAGTRLLAAGCHERGSTRPTSSCPAATPSSAIIDYVLDSNSMYENIADMGDIPLAVRERPRALSARRRDPQGRQLHPDQRRAGQWQARGLHPGLPPAWGEHAEGREHAGRLAQGLRRAADALGDQPEAGHGPVGLCAEVDRGPGAGRGAGRDPLLAGHPDVPGRDADDGDRDHDAADLDHGVLGRPLFHRARRST